MALSKRSVVAVLVVEFVGIMSRRFWCAVVVLLREDGPAGSLVFARGVFGGSGSLRREGLAGSGFTFGCNRVGLSCLGSDFCSARGFLSDTGCFSFDSLEAIDTAGCFSFCGGTCVSALSPFVSTALRLPPSFPSNTCSASVSGSS